MSYERSTNKNGSWGSIYPRVFTILALGLELALIIVTAQLLRIRMTDISPLISND